MSFVGQNVVAVMTASLQNGAAAVAAATEMAKDTDTSTGELGLVHSKETARNDCM